MFFSSGFRLLFYWFVPLLLPLFEVKAPVCEVCSATGSLCQSCQSKLDSGKISQLDVRVSALLHELEKRFALEAVEFEKSFEAPKLVVLVTSTDPGVLIGKGGRVASELSKSLGKHVKIIGSKQERHFAVEELLAPTKPLGINELFSSSGKKYKLRIARYEHRRLPMPLDTIKQVLAFLYGGTVDVVFE